MTQNCEDFLCSTMLKWKTWEDAPKMGKNKEIFGLIRSNIPKLQKEEALDPAFLWALLVVPSLASGTHRLHSLASLRAQHPCVFVREDAARCKYYSLPYSGLFGAWITSPDIFFCLVLSRSESRDGSGTAAILSPKPSWPKLHQSAAINKFLLFNSCSKLFNRQGCLLFSVSIDDIVSKQRTIPPKKYTVFPSTTLKTHKEWRKDLEYCSCFG